MTPASTREGVREGIFAALEREDLRAGEGAARRLAGAAIAGIAAAAGLTMLFASDSHEAEPAWHLVLCSAVWAGLLVEAFAFVLLRIRTRRVPIGPAVALGLVGLALATAMRLLCPDLRPLHWWSSTWVGRSADLLMGASASALCLGTCGAAVIGFAACVALSLRGAQPRGALTPAIALSLLLLPAVALQSAALSWGLTVAWSLGTVLGSYLGIASAQRLGASRVSLGGSRPTIC